MKKIKVGVIFGGQSTEHEISVISGSSVIKNLNKEKYQICPIYISKEGNWYKYTKPVENVEIFRIGEEPKELEKIDNIVVYNKNSDSGIVMFNIKDVFAQDTAVYLNNYNICVRAGNHCAKILKDELGIKNTCRISLYFYNTKEDIDKLVEVLDNDNILRDSLI